MSQYPLNELKRHLDDEGIPLPKRLKLAKNVIHSHHFPTGPKERVISEWLNDLTQCNRLTSKELRDVLGWLNSGNDLTNELKCKLIKVVSQYLHNNTLHKDDIQHILSLLENEKISVQLSAQIDEYLFIITTLLQNLHSDVVDNVHLLQKILKNVGKYYRDSKKKLEFVIKFVEGENLETVFSYLDTPCRDSVVELCQIVLFPISKKQFFASFLNNLIRKDNIEELIAERGDNIQSVIKIMSAFFTFPKGRTEKNQKFLSDFIDVFVTCFRSESQIVFGFNIMAASSLNMTQNYMVPAMKMPPIIFEEHDDKIKRNLFLNMLEVLLKNEVDINVRLTDTLGEKISKMEIKKTLLAFTQAVMMGQLKLEGKLDKTTLKIITTALKLDPSLIEQKVDKILPHIMAVKKNNTDIINIYTESINCLLDTLFKLSKGIDFVNQIIPHLKINLEAMNVEQFELKQKLNEAIANGENCDKIRGKILTGNDILPPECIEVYGKLASELMFRQNRELLRSLQKDLEENCLMMLEEGFVSPSIITLAEVISAILSSFLCHSKMADHTVSIPVAEEFWSAFQSFEDQCLNKFGSCILKLNYNPPLVLAFLKLCLSFSQLKLLNIKYGNTKLSVTTESVVLPFLNSNEWIEFSSKLQKDEAVLVWNHLQLIKTMAIQVLSDQEIDENASQTLSETKSNLIKQLSNYPHDLSSNDYFTSALFTDLDKNQLKQLAKILVKLYLNDQNVDIFKTDAVYDNKELLQALVLKTAKNITDNIEIATSLGKALNKSSFDMATFIKDVDIKVFFDQNEIQNQEEVIRCVDMLKNLQIYYLDENYQLTAVFVLLVLKKCCQSKKLKRNIDNILQSIFEMSPKYPDLYKLFPVEFIFNFNDNSMLNLLQLTNKTANNLLILKCILELGVKKVKTDADIVKNIVETLLKNHKSKGKISSIEYFSDPVFQISCILLPLIAKEKKAITTSAFRSVLANLQDRLNQAMLNSFKNIDFSSNSSLLVEDTGNPDDSVVSDNNLATLNAMGAYSLTLLKCCENTDKEEIKNLDCLWSGLGFFIQNAIQTIQNPSSKSQHIESAIQLLNVTLRYIKKLETHEIFKEKDKLFHQIWQSLKSRLLMVHDNRQKRKISNSCLEEMAVALKFLAELSSVECFGANFVGDLSNLALLKKPSIILKNDDLTQSQLTSRRVSRYLWQNCLKANIIGPKCIAMTKLIFRATKNIRFWVQQNYDCVSEKQNGGQDGDCGEIAESEIKETNVVKIEDPICELLRNDLDVLSEVILAAKKISLDFKFLDAIFELQHLMHYILGRNAIDTKCEVSWQGFVTIYEGCVAMLNNLLLSREELLEDRWPCYMQCYKALVLSLCERANSQSELDRSTEHKLAEMSHSIEKLTQSMCKRKSHVSRISAYAVADICTWLENNPPPKMVRQHLENSVALLIQVSDSTYALAFLRRALAGSAGQMTLTNMYTMYKRYHKYVGNA